MQHARHFSELIAWQRARALARDLFEVSEAFPSEERYALTDQVRCSSRSVGAQIAEAWGKRPYERHFLSKLSDADAEQYETQHWIIIAYDAGYQTREQAQQFGTTCKEIGSMLGKVMSKSSTFCQDPESASFRVKEDDTEDFFEDQGDSPF